MFPGKVRNGFVRAWAELRHLQTSACPFGDLPEKKRTKWALTREMKNCA